MKLDVTDVFFDLDHTLWDFDKNSALTFEKILLKNEISIDLEEFLSIYVPINKQYWRLYSQEKINKEALKLGRLKDTFDALKYSVSEKAINNVASDYLEVLPSFNHLMPNALHILEYLKTSYNLHIITNGFHEIQNGKLRNSNIDHYFTHVINSEMVGVKKPNPIIFEYALNLSKVHAKQSVMIGDSLEDDIMGAQNAGLCAIHFNPLSIENAEENLINDLIELKRYL